MIKTILTGDTDNLNDCGIVAVSQFLDKDYDEVYRDFKPFLRDEGSTPIGAISNYHPIKDELLCEMVIMEPWQRQKVNHFVKKHSKGTYILVVKSYGEYHFVCMKDGIFYEKDECPDFYQKGKVKYFWKRDDE